MKALFINASPRKNWNTMNCPEDYAPKMHYPELLAPNASACELVLGYCETLCAYKVKNIPLHD